MRAQRNGQSNHCDRSLQACAGLVATLMLKVVYSGLETDS